MEPGHCMVAGEAKTSATCWIWWMQLLLRSCLSACVKPTESKM
jgi:hypothetical protein